MTQWGAQSLSLKNFLSQSTTKSAITSAITFAAIMYKNVSNSIALTPFTQTEATGPDNGNGILSLVLKKFNAANFPVNVAGIFFCNGQLNAWSQLFSRNSVTA